MKSWIALLGPDDRTFLADALRVAGNTRITDLVAEGVARTTEAAADFQLRCHYVASELVQP